MESEKIEIDKEKLKKFKTSIEDVILDLASGNEKLDEIPKEIIISFYKTLISKCSKLSGKSEFKIHTEVLVELLSDVCSLLK